MGHTVGCGCCSSFSHICPSSCRPKTLLRSSSTSSSIMAMSGVKLTEACMATYQDIQKSKKHRYAIFVIRDGQIEVETVGERNNSYSDFLADLHQMDGDADDFVMVSMIMITSLILMVLSPRSNLRYF